MVNSVGMVSISGNVFEGTGFDHAGGLKEAGALCWGDGDEK